MRFFLTLLLFTAKLSAATLKDPHIMMMQADTEFFWLSYYFAVNNETAVPEEFSTPILLPKATLDFIPQMGLEAGDLQQDASGQLTVKKAFAPGVTLVAIGYKIPYSTDNPSLLFTTPIAMPEFSFTTSKASGLLAHSETMTSGTPPMLSDGNYVGLVKNDIPANSSITINISGLPEGRKTLWLLGLLFSLTLILSSACCLLLSERQKSSAIDF
jgi:hypothetical protein